MRHAEGDPIGLPKPFEDREPGPEPDANGVVRGWFVYVDRYLYAVAQPPVDWTSDQGEIEIRRA